MKDVPETGGTRPARAGAAFWLPAAALVPLLLLIFRFNFLCDDAFISFRYARNLADGLGLRYNPGVTPPVEGYSEFLWVIVMSIFERLRLDVTWWSRILSAAAAGRLLFLVTTFVRRHVSPRPWLVTASAFFLVTLPPFAVWSTGGLATMPFTLGVFLLFTRLMGALNRRRSVEAAIVALFVALIRADGLYWVILTIGTALTTEWLTRRKISWTAYGITAAILVAGFGAYEIWRFTYHGALVPNTASAKVSLTAAAFQAGGYYVLNFLLALPSVAIVGISSAFLLRRTDPLPIQCLAMIAGTFAYAVITGGDFMCWGRFLVPALPFLAVLFGLLMLRLGETSPTRSLRVPLAIAMMLLSILPAWNIHLVPSAIREAVPLERNLSSTRTELDQWRDMKARMSDWKRLGRALKLRTHPGDSLVHGNVGAVGYYSGLFIYDQFGLITRGNPEDVDSERQTAPGHHRYVRASYFRDQKPTYFGAKLARVDDPSQLVSEWTSDASGRVEIRMFPLGEEADFERTDVLVLARWPETLPR